MVIRLTELLDKKKAGDSRRYAVERWNYDWHAYSGGGTTRISGRTMSDGAWPTAGRVKAFPNSVKPGTKPP